jgi:CubicO group peptidase (beta-lactamase class C family)
MSTHTALLALALLAAPLSPARAQGPVAAPAPTQDSAAARLRTRVDSIFARYNGTDRPGCAVGLSRNGTLLLERGYGMADLESGRPITPETVFESGSVAKQFVAATIVLLAQEGKLSLDDKLRRHLPELPPWADSITLRQMLGHTSGLRDQWTLFEIQGRPLGSVAHRLADVLELAKRQQRLNFAPGTQWLYSNMGYILAGLVIQRASGDSLPVTSRRLLFEPLGLTHTGWRSDFRTVVPGRAQAYSPGAGGGFVLDMPFSLVYGSGGMLTTVGDWLRWNDLLTADRVGRPGTAALLATPASLPDGRSTGYGLGLSPTRATAGLGEEIGHGGSTAGYRTFLARYSGSGLSVAVLCNRGDANAQALARAAVRAVLGAPVPTPPAAQRLAPEVLRRWVGLYRDSVTGEVMPIALRDSALYAGFGSGQRMIALDSARFLVGGRVADFRRDGARVLARPDSVGPFTAVQVPVATPTPAQLAALAGDYRSAELEVVYHILARGDTLSLQAFAEPPERLAPMDADGFSAPDSGIQLTFTRDRRGQVDGFEVFAGRVLHLRFDRMAGGRR